jgi:hypothetical protein
VILFTESNCQRLVLVGASFDEQMTGDMFKDLLVSVTKTENMSTFE